MTVLPALAIISQKSTMSGNYRRHRNSRFRRKGSTLLQIQQYMPRHSTGHKENERHAAHEEMRAPEMEGPSPQPVGLRKGKGLTTVNIVEQDHTALRCPSTRPRVPTSFTGRPDRAQSTQGFPATHLRTGPRRCR